MPKPKATWHRTIPPAVQPTSVAAARKQLRIAESVLDHDSQLTDLIDAAREQFEHDTQFITAQQTIELILDRFPRGSNPIDIPVRPVISLGSIQYQTTPDDEAVTLTTARLSRDGKKLLPAAGQDWPAAEEHPEAVVITLVVGHANVAAVPKLCRQAILLQVAKWFEDPDMSQSRTEEQFDQAYERIVRRFIRTSYP